MTTYPDKSFYYENIGFYLSLQKKMKVRNFVFLCTYILKCSHLIKKGNDGTDALHVNN